jgi:glutaredoxin 3
MNTKEVKVYSTTTCPYCIMEKQWLDANKITHKVVYVDLDHKEARNMINNTGQMGVPVTELTLEDGNKKYIVGFDKLELKKVIGF